MANEPLPPAPPPPPPPPQIPNLWPIIGQLLQAFISSPWLRAVVTAAMAAFGTVYLVKQSLPAVPDLIRKGLPRILPRPKKAEDAIGKITFGNAGCTATIIGPVMSDDTKLDILTAAHCVKLGAFGMMKLKDGRELKVQCVARDPESDAAWLAAAKPDGDVPYLLLAESNPQDGEAVWHQGYGIDRPANRESGIYKGVRSEGLQLKFYLSVSPGDSGGGIILDSDGNVLSPVCCTTRLSAKGDVFGASPQAAARIRPRRKTEALEEILVYPILALPDPPYPEPPVISERKN